MSILQNLTFNKHEESKCVASAVDYTSQEFSSALNFLKIIFGKKFRMNTNDDYSVSFSFKHDKENILNFSCRVRITENDVSDTQLSLFSAV
ncbi:MAG: hypothetical protein NTV87_15990, partial [Ignavibacteriae bacterium]|nr:hypothetical protein [Ignavibacteriota bacterium]